jgi:hypothetical protein
VALPILLVRPSRPAERPAGAHQSSSSELDAAHAMSSHTTEALAFVAAAGGLIAAARLYQASRAQHQAAREARFDASATKSVRSVHDSTEMALGAGPDGAPGPVEVEHFPLMHLRDQFPDAETFQRCAACEQARATSSEVATTTATARSTRFEAAGGRRAQRHAGVNPTAADCCMASARWCSQCGRSSSNVSLHLVLSPLRAPLLLLQPAGRPQVAAQPELPRRQRGDPHDAGESGHAVGRAWLYRSRTSGRYTRLQQLRRLLVSTPGAQARGRQGVPVGGPLRDALLGPGHGERKGWRRARGRLRACGTAPRAYPGRVPLLSPRCYPAPCRAAPRQRRYALRSSRAAACARGSTQ